jgi:hypothetical protein
MRSVFEVLGVEVSNLMPALLRAATPSPATESSPSFRMDDAPVSTRVSVYDQILQRSPTPVSTPNGSVQEISATEYEKALLACKHDLEMMTLTHSKNMFEQAEQNEGKLMEVKHALDRAAEVRQRVTSTSMHLPVKLSLNVNA